MTSWCPLCPNVFPNSVNELALHFNNKHHMNNSAFILAMSMYNPYGREEVFQVLKDVRQKDYELKKQKDLVTSYRESIANTDTEVINLRKNVEDLKADIARKNEEKTLLDQEFRKDKENSDEIVLKKDQTIAILDAKIKNLENGVKELGIQLSNKKCNERILEQNFRNCKDQSDVLISEKDQKIANLEVQVKKVGMEKVELKVQLKHEREVKVLLERDLEKFKECSNKKISEKDRNLDLDIQELKAQLSNSDKENMLLKRGIKKFKGQSEAIIAKKEQTIKDLEDDITNL